MKKYLRLVPIITFPFFIVLTLFYVFGFGNVLNYISDIKGYTFNWGDLFILLIFIFWLVAVLIYGISTGSADFSGMESIFINSSLLLFLMLLLIGVAAVICSIIEVASSLIKKRDSQEILRINMIIRLIHIPANIIIFLTGLRWVLYVFSFPIAVGLMFLNGMVIFSTCIIGLCGIIRGLSEKKLSIKSAVVLGFFQFVFCLDIVGSIIAFRKVKTAN